MNIFSSHSCFLVLMPYAQEDGGIFWCTGRNKAPEKTGDVCHNVIHKSENSKLNPKCLVFRHSGSHQMNQKWGLREVPDQVNRKMVSVAKNTSNTWRSTLLSKCQILWPAFCMHYSHWKQFLGTNYVLEDLTNDKVFVPEVSITCLNSRSGGVGIQQVLSLSTR